MSFTPTSFNEGGAPGISAAELNKLGTQYEQALIDAAVDAATKAAAVVWFTTQNVVTASRAIDGPVYRNTSTKTMMVTVSGVVTGSGNYPSLEAYSDSSATPTTQVASNAQQMGYGAVVSITFMVLAGNYYNVNGVYGHTALYLWVEWV